MTVDDALRSCLDSLGVSYEIFPCDPALADTAAFCEAYGYPPAGLGEHDRGDRQVEPPKYVACVALATTRLDVNRAVKPRLGTRKASFAGAEHTVELTGMEIGGVTLFGSSAGGAAVDGRGSDGAGERIVLGGGQPLVQVLVSPAMLAAARRRG